MEYGQGALESMAVNASRSFELQGNQSKDCNAPSLTDLLSMNKQIEDKADKHFATKLKEEFKCDSKGATSALSTAIQHLEDKMQVSAKYLPPLVKSTRHQVIHKNTKALVFLPSTNCGWYYYLAYYQFVEGGDAMVTCAKCLVSAQRKEVNVADTI